MSAPPVEPADLLDLKLLPAWMKEPAEPRNYPHYAAEDEARELRRPRGRKGKRPTPTNRERTSNRPGATPHKFKKGGRDSERVRERAHKRPDRKKYPHHEDRPKVSRQVVPPVAIRFLPYSPAFENVVAQIKSGSVAYSLFALARLFLEKPVGSETHSDSLTAISTNSRFQRPIQSREIFQTWRDAA